MDRLLAEGLAVLVVDDLSTGNQENLPHETQLERCDVASAELGDLFHRWRAGIVFHLAAQASVPLSIRDPLRDVAVNVIGTHRVAEAARDVGAARLVFISSGGAVYGETRRSATEETRPAPSSYYGIHKLAAEGHVALARLPFTILRPSNVYGPRQVGGLEGAVVAAFLEQASRQGTLVIHGDGSQTRDLVHVRDLVEALWRLAQPDSPVGTWNVSSGRSVTIAGLADSVERVFGRPLGRTFVTSRPGDVARSAISSAQLRGLGWRPHVGLSAGLGELVRLIGEADGSAFSAGRPDPHA